MEPRRSVVTAVQVTDENRFDVLKTFQEMGVPVNMNWNEQYTEWRIWVQTEYGWRKVTEGMWFVQDTAFSDLWVAMSDHNLHRKYVEVSDPPKDTLEEFDIDHNSVAVGWPIYDH